MGKSTVTANLAAALSERGRVLAVDADLEMANLDLIFGCRGDHVFDLQDLYLERCVVQDAFFSVPGHSRVSALFAPLHREVPSLALLLYLRDLIEDQRNAFDFLLIDCPSGVGALPEVFADPRNEALIIATPDLTSVSDGERMANALFGRGIGRVRLLVNRVRPALIRKGLAPDVDMIIDSTSLQLVGLIPEDTAVIRGENTGALAYDLPRARCRTPFSNVARRLEGETVDLARFS